MKFINFTTLFVLIASVTIDAGKVDQSSKIDKANELIAAAREGNLINVQNLIEQGVEANIQGGNALVTAARNGHLQVVEYLVGKGPEKGLVEANVKKGKALIDAARNGFEKVVKYLIEEGPEDTRVKDDDQKQKALLEAAENGKLNVVQYLYEEGPGKRSHEEEENRAIRMFALGKAASKGHKQVLKYLIGKETDVSILQKIVDGLACIAADFGQSQVVKYLVETPKANVQDGEALIEAAKKGYSDIVKYLIEEAAVKANIEDGNKHSALFHAVDNGNFEVVEYLLGIKPPVFGRKQYEMAQRCSKARNIKDLFTTYEQYKR